MRRNDGKEPIFAERRVEVAGACVGYNYKICSCRPHTLRAVFLPAIARSANLGGWRSVLEAERVCTDLSYNSPALMFVTLLSEAGRTGGT